MRHPEFHDGQVLGVSLRSERSAEIVVTTLGGAEFKLLLKGLRNLRVTDFKEGNIILDVEIAKGETISAASLRQLLDVSSGEMTDVIEQRRDAVARGDLTFVNLTPSYGCEILALCEACHIAKT